MTFDQFLAMAQLIALGFIAGTLWECKNALEAILQKRN